MEYSDHDLVRGIRAGDRSALDILIRRWYPRVYGYIFKLTGHEQDAYDLTQEVCIAMMRALPSYRPWKPFEGWLFTIARNKCLDYFRLRRQTVSLEEAGPDGRLSVPPPDEAVLLSAAVRDALDKLPAVQREAAVLHYGYQLTAAEIARRTGAPLPTVKSRLKAARKALAASLRKEDFL